MEGEKEYTRAMYELVQELIRQLLQHDGEPFTYAFQPKLEITKLEQLYIIRALARKGVIKFKERMVSDIFMHNEGIEAKIYNRRRFVITASKDKLEQYAISLGIDHKAKEVHTPQKKINCRLLFNDNDREFKLKIGDFTEQLIGKLNDGSTVYELTAALFRNPAGVYVNRLDVVANYKSRNLWQAYTRNGYSYLKPFFSSADNRIAKRDEVELTVEQVLSMIPKIAEKYRNNFDFIEKDLRR